MEEVMRDLYWHMKCVQVEEEHVMQYEGGARAQDFN